MLERIGRLRQQYSRAAHYYDITVEPDEASAKATAIRWKRNKTVDETLPGVYCLRTNQGQWDEATLWHTYTMLTDLEAVFRSLKSELGLRPVFHQKTDRVLGVHIIGARAADMIAECVLAIEFGAGSEDIARTIHGHPTFAEALQEAAMAVQKCSIYGS